jgi:hypothetical protein
MGRNTFGMGSTDYGENWQVLVPFGAWTNSLEGF